MKKSLILLLALLLGAPAARSAGQEPFSRLTVSPLPALGAGGGKGVSAAFGGTLPDGRILAAGGCNFPGIPAAQGGAKQYYADIYLLGPDGWNAAGRLPRAAAYGVGVSLPDGVACLGGESAEGDGLPELLDAACVLRPQAGAGAGGLEIQPLPPLELDGRPLPLAEAAGCYADGYIYVAGGRSAGGPSQAVVRLKYPGGTAWERLPDLPGGARLQAVAAVQHGATGTGLYVMGGYAPRTPAARGRLQGDVLRLDLRGLGWQRLVPPPGQAGCVPTAGAVAVTSGYAHILVAGGVDARRFTAAINGEAGDDYLCHAAEWYRFDDRLRAFHTVTGTWTVTGRDARLARAGALVAPDGKNSYVVAGGETMPGIRSTQATRLDIGGQRTFGWAGWTVLTLYLLAMLALGYYFMRREQGADDFFKGGGRIPWWAAGISIYATMLSAITYMAYPAKAYATDWTYYPMLVTILVVSLPVMHYYLPFFRRLDVTSAYEYLERRFNAATRLMASALFIVFMVARMALVLYLPSLALTAVTGIDIYVCIVLMGLVTIVYCTMGGVEAVVWGDVVQGFILVGGAVLAVVYLVGGTEGGAAAFSRINFFFWPLHSSPILYRVGFNVAPD